MNIVGTPCSAVQRSSDNRRQHRGGIEHFAREHHRRARAHAGENRQHHAEAMIERHRNAEPIRLAKFNA